MFIEIEDLRDEPLHVRHVYGLGEILLQHKDASLEEPISVDFTLTHKNQDLQLGGMLETAVRYTCSRCLCEFSRNLSTSFDLFYLPQPKGIREDEEIALKYEDMEVGYYDGIRLDVDLMVLEQIELSMPMQYICREECGGLCPKCGANQNEGACLCGQEETDSRMAVLLEFRKKMNKSEQS